MRDCPFFDIILIADDIKLTSMARIGSDLLTFSFVDLISSTTASRGQSLVFMMNSLLHPLVGTIYF